MKKPVLEWFSKLYRINLLFKLKSSSLTSRHVWAWWLELDIYMIEIIGCQMYNYWEKRSWFCFSFQQTGHKVGFKPAGGIRSAKDALTWLSLMKEELGDDWTHPNLFRIGASSLLGDIERQLFHHVTGRWVLNSGRKWELLGDERKKTILFLRVR